MDDSQSMVFLLLNLQVLNWDSSLVTTLSLDFLRSCVLKKPPFFLPFYFLILKMSLLETGLNNFFYISTQLKKLTIHVVNNLCQI